MTYRTKIHFKPVMATITTKFNFLHKGRMCACGHHMKYHIQGTSKCLFGVCGCDGYAACSS